MVCRYRCSIASPWSCTGVSPSIDHRSGQCPCQSQLATSYLQMGRASKRDALCQSSHPARPVRRRCVGHARGDIRGDAGLERGGEGPHLGIGTNGRNAGAHAESSACAHRTEAISRSHIDRRDTAAVRAGCRGLRAAPVGRPSVWASSPSPSSATARPSRSTPTSGRHGTAASVNRLNAWLLSNREGFTGIP